MNQQTDGAEVAQAPKPRRRYSTKLGHPGYIIQECPREECGFPEADGGYCPECGYIFHPADCPCIEHLARAQEAERRKKEKGAKGA